MGLIHEEGKRHSVVVEDLGPKPAFILPVVWIAHRLSIRAGYIGKWCIQCLIHHEGGQAHPKIPDFHKKTPENLNPCASKSGVSSLIYLLAMKAVHF